MRRTRLFYGSSYDRGLEILLKMWPKIIEKYPKAELHVCYGWDFFDSAFADNPERQGWKEKINKMMRQPGIVHHGRIGKEKLKQVREHCGIWAYPTFFAEINCITALEAQRDGCVPVTMNEFALKETVMSGVKLDGDIYDPEIQEKYVKGLLDLMGDEQRWLDEQAKGREAVKDYEWEKIAEKWDVELKA